MASQTPELCSDLNVLIVAQSARSRIVICDEDVPDVSTHFLFFVVGDLVSGPKGSIPGPGGAFEGVWDPQK